VRTVYTVDHAKQAAVLQSLEDFLKVEVKWRRVVISRCQIKAVERIVRDEEEEGKE
jgi:hypothetical protein